MSASSREPDVLFINGINTEFGGSGTEALKTWMASFEEHRVSWKIFGTVPRFHFTRKSRWYFLLLSFYFLPGTLFRVFHIPIFEFVHKLSPVLLVRFLRCQAATRPRKVIFSHHASFYLAFFTTRARRIFLIHDLMYIRAKSRGTSRRLQRLCLTVELWIYQFAPTLLVQSYQEWRLLRRLLKNRIHLISCCSLQLAGAVPSSPGQALAVVSDWRRPENTHGAIRFFSSVEAAAYNAQDLQFRFFGFGSGKLIEQLTSARLSPRIHLLDGGAFRSLTDIKEGYFFVPIYRGAGIKRKTLEALSAGRMVIGTREAFIGLPSWAIADVTRRVAGLHDLRSMPALPGADAFAKVLQGLSERFRGVGEIPELHEASPGNRPNHSIYEAGS